MSERGRWLPLEDGGDPTAPAGGNGHGANAPVEETSSGCTADELIALLGHRGLAGWAFLVRDVAAGRIRRLYLRQLPADPEIRRALIAYLQSAGTEVTLSRTFREQQRRSQSA